MLRKIFYLLPFIFYLVLSCANPFANQSLSMTADPGVTEAWISLHVDGVKSGADYIVQRDGKNVFKGRLQSADTVVYDSLLQPATTYTYRFFARENGDDSPALQSSLTTMDTTSHNFSWQSYEFGGQNGSSYFNDVAIIDENDIWAVGEIHTDSTDRWNKDGTEWLQPYNAAHWDGQKWTLKRILFHTFCSSGALSTYPAKAVFYIDNTLLVSSGSEIIFIKNQVQIKSNCTPVSINKIWGTSDNNLYVVGYGGLIAHYDGKGWTKIESGTDLDIKDIWGIAGDDNNPVILAVTLADNSTYKPKVLKIQNNRVTAVFVDIYRYLLGVWFDSPNKYYLCGAGIFYKSKTEINWHETLPYGTHLIVTYKIRGSAENNIWLAGQRGLLIHFNGKTWKISEPLISAIDYQGIDVKDNLAVAVGFKNSKAIITRIKLNP